MWKGFFQLFWFFCCWSHWLLRYLTKQNTIFVAPSNFSSPFIKIFLSGLGMYPFVFLSRNKKELKSELVLQ